jgi:hypothetical protein
LRTVKAEVDVDPLDILSERAEAIASNIEFLFGEVTEDDETVIRAMLLFNGSDAQIVDSFTIAATKTQVPREDKGKYAFGCLKNMLRYEVDVDIDDEPYE